ncbi:AMP-binding protein [Actinokineospora diospyrosa]|uniref:Acyl-CoA synthetase (AMP-forming)/AMP-acid ligase II n=1 Tax=Actinokineospora diospyrosa TaxID=103728 RepID=A0ABT1I632_9PSEU|nr:AMP-binding protein [Actinokineospora diospyrosa]MCP2267856.1 Acyl-CoA synthetase (AMP-forming)/AMP-acid ligase II [Actinokineospora diospyrosa]
MSELSVLDGGPAPRLDAQCLGELLPRAAARSIEPSIHLIAADGAQTRLSYADLLDAAARVLGGLRAAGVRVGERVVVHQADNQDLLTAFWACVLGGFVAVPTGAAPSGLGRDYRWLVADEPLPRGPRWAGSVARLRDNAPDKDWVQTELDDVVLLSSTAGSSGAPKTVALTNRAVLSRSAATIEDNDLDEHAVTFNSMPLDHVGGLVMFHLRDVQLACTQVHAHRLWISGDPARWLDIADRFGVTLAWGTTSALEAIAARAGSGAWDLSGLRYVMNGGEPVLAATIRRFTAALAPFGLPATAVRPGWGMSETAAGVIDHRVDPAELTDPVPVGKPHAGIAVRVVDASGIVPVGAQGRLQIRGESVTRGYIDGPTTPFTEDGWLDTGDLAVVRGGLLTITGTLAGALTVDGTTHHASAIEATVSELPGARKGSVGATLGDDGLVLLLEGNPDPAQVRAAVSAAHGLTPARLRYLADGEFPKTRTGKPRRAALRELTSTSDSLSSTHPH